jgi:hypothetical protein
MQVGPVRHTIALSRDPVGRAAADGRDTWGCFHPDTGART